MNEQMPPAVTGPVEPTVRRPLGMPDYTPDQKAAAFDALWETCGLGRGLLRDWVDRPVSRAAKEATFIRVPRYTFEILAEGEGMQRFRDVLHHLATRKGGPNPTAKRRRRRPLERPVRPVATPPDMGNTPSRCRRHGRFETEQADRLADRSNRCLL